MGVHWGLGQILGGQLGGECFESGRIELCSMY
jgi:hypothetical protein